MHQPLIALARKGDERGALRRDGVGEELVGAAVVAEVARSRVGAPGSGSVG